jgi:hypothetical protein
MLVTRIAYSTVVGEFSLNAAHFLYTLRYFGLWIIFLL